MCSYDVFLMMFLFRIKSIYRELYLFCEKINQSACDPSSSDGLIFSPESNLAFVMYDVWPLNSVSYSNHNGSKYFHLNCFHSNQCILVSVWHFKRLFLVLFGAQATASRSMAEICFEFVRTVFLWMAENVYEP